MKKLNLAGRLVNKLRNERGWTLVNWPTGSGKMTTLRTAVHGVKSAKNGSAFCVTDTSDDSVVLLGIKQWKRLFLVSTSEERA